MQQTTEDAEIDLEYVEGGESIMATGGVGGPQVIGSYIGRATTTFDCLNCNRATCVFDDAKTAQEARSEYCRMYNRRHRDERRRQNLEQYYRLKMSNTCCSCASRPKVKGYELCRECLDRHSENNKKRATMLKKHGICIQCGKFEAEEGKVRCRICLEKRRQESRAYRLRRKLLKKAASVCRH